MKLLGKQFLMIGKYEIVVIQDVVFVVLKVNNRALFVKSHLRTDATENQETRGMFRCNLLVL